MLKLPHASHKRVGKEKDCVDLVRIDKGTSCQLQIEWYIKHVILYANRKIRFIFRLKSPKLHLYVTKEKASKVCFCLPKNINVEDVYVCSLVSW